MSESHSISNEPLSRIAIEAHLHFYPFYNLTQFFIALTKNLNSLVPYSAKATPEPIVQIALLAESAEQNFFCRLRDNPPSLHSFGMRLEIHKDGNALLLKHNLYGIFFIIAGRQIVTKERLEIIAVGTTQLIPDGNPFFEVFQYIQKLGALPALPWGFGKWIGKRGFFLKRMLNVLQKPFFLIDSSLRPIWFKESSIFKKARSCNLHILAGSDPLPIRGQEFFAGTYVATTIAPFDTEHPFKSFCKIISSDATHFICAGRRRRTGDIFNALFELRRSEKNRFE